MKAGGDHEILGGTLLLLTPPLHLRVVAGVEKVAPAIEIDHGQAVDYILIDPH